MEITLTRQTIISTLQANGAKIKSFGVHRLGLFGSFRRDEARPDSDVDLLVEFDPPQKTFDNFIQLAFFLEEVLQRRVELVTLESLSPYLRPYIISEAEDVPLTP